MMNNKINAQSLDYHQYLNNWYFQLDVDDNIYHAILFYPMQIDNSNDSYLEVTGKYILIELNKAYNTYELKTESSHTLYIDYDKIIDTFKDVISLEQIKKIYTEYCQTIEHIWFD